MANDSDNQKVGELLKKLVSAGIGAAFMTEESIRTYLSELKLPKDVLNLLLQGANKSKEELMNRVGTEVIKIISRIDFVGEASRFVEEHKFRISAEIDVVKKDHASATTNVESRPASGESRSTSQVERGTAEK